MYMSDSSDHGIPSTGAARRLCDSNMAYCLRLRWRHLFKICETARFASTREVGCFLPSPIALIKDLRSNVPGSIHNTAAVGRERTVPDRRVEWPDGDVPCWHDINTPHKLWYPTSLKFKTLRTADFGDMTNITLVKRPRKRVGIEALTASVNREAQVPTHTLCRYCSAKVSVPTVQQLTRFKAFIITSQKQPRVQK
jgi:hypothetical protein